MLGKFLLLASLTFAAARPSSEDRDSRQVLSELCPTSAHWLIPHEWDCTKFYYCAYGYKNINPTSCAPGTQFSYELQVCVHPWQANCNLPGVPSTTLAPTTQAPTTQAPTTQRPTPLPTQPPTRPPTAPPTINPPGFLPNGCPTDFNIHYLLPHETNCSKFYICVLAEKVEKECPSGTHFNSNIQDCDWPWNAGCSNGVTTAPTQPQPPTQPPTTPPTRPPTRPPTAPPTVPPTINPPGFLPNGCPTDFNIHYLLPHETDCSKFYQCVFADKVVKDCPSGTHFNPTIQDCDWPWDAGCSNGVTPPPTQPPTRPPTPLPTRPPTTPPTQLPTRPPTAPPTINPPGFLPNGCPTDFNIHYLLPHETDCNKFYICVLAEKVVKECPSGTHFNPNTQDCDWPWDAGCSNGVTSPPTQPPTRPPTPPPTRPPTAPPTINPPGFLPNGCPTDFNIHYLLPHETDCSKFYICVLAEKVVKECPSGNHFNPTTKDCDWPWNAGCTNGISTPVTTPPPTAPPGFLPNGCPTNFNIHYLLPHETTCSKFYYCVFGEKVERDCAPGTHFNPTIQVCDWPSDAGCINGVITPAPTLPPTPQPTTQPPIQPPTRPPIQPPTRPPIQPPTQPPIQPPTRPPIQPPTQPPTTDPPGFLPNGCPTNFHIHHLLPHETNCSRFYYCVFGEKVERDCAPSTHFNPTIQVCDWPDNAGCLNGISTPAPTLPPPTIKPPGVLPNGCPTDFNIHHLLPHETSCNKFYYCVFGEKVERDCPVGTHFNPKLQVCDWPENAGCSSNENGGNGSDICKNSCNILPWAHGDCDKFWRCDGQNEVLITCSEGLHFNPSLGSCDFACNSGCIRREAQATYSSEGIRLFLPWDKVDSIAKKLVKYSNQ